jgi:hypothetical protein
MLALRIRYAVQHTTAHRRLSGPGAEGGQVPVPVRPRGVARHRPVGVRQLVGRRLYPGQDDEPPDGHPVDEETLARFVARTGPADLLRPTDRRSPSRPGFRSTPPAGRVE